MRRGEMDPAGEAPTEAGRNKAIAGLVLAVVLGAFAVHAAPPWIGLVGAGPVALTSLRALDPPARPGSAGDGAAPAGFSLRDPPRRYKHLSFIRASAGRPKATGSRRA